MAGRRPDSASGRNFLRRGSQQRERLERASVRRPQTHEDLQWMCVDEVTGRVAQMSEDDKRAAFEGSDYFSRHFPHLDPRRAGDPATPAGPVMWLPRVMIVSFIRSWPAERRDRFFHEAPWMRPDFPEFEPAGGWPPPLVYPPPDPDPVQGPPNLWEPDRAYRLGDVMDPATGEFVPCPPASPPPEARPRDIAWQHLSDPTWYRRDDFEHGWPPPSFWRAAGARRRRDRRENGYLQWARRQRRNDPDCRPYPPRGPCGEVWDDNWTPAQGRQIPAFRVMSPQGY
ncbi:hypothetical protein MPTK1_3g11040 [Marchantia polymorpha subsp. ruderalis]|uniref:Uncharacterized protein n=2 Tax=Marchantia polymorpha TaxID=3197 RepID=A0AAF6AZK2_MARPO|nr:hypothetical protein MARPO_0037s0092 [Marchantia polymorpha]BBN05186.1 hypothetical protein Mp_3g11040 [Marchantia polymorpha subsp. ruderalis]|eukprot:PTQ40918.1 hypothetical protein MARPO_0037s0092 [Marchantia polymorpha]